MEYSLNQLWVAEDEEDAIRDELRNDATQEPGFSDASDPFEIPDCMSVPDAPTNGENESDGDDSRRPSQPIRLGMDSPLGRWGF